MTPLRIVDGAFQLIAFLFAISVHESAHAWMADRRGDPTARMLGRITLNPIKHIDPIGTILLPAMGLYYGNGIFGWAKPTPVDPRNFKSPVVDDILTSVVGPVSNFVIATGSLILLMLVSHSSTVGHQIVADKAFYLAGLLTPPDSPLVPVVLFLDTMMWLNVLLGVFNLIPVPPLDGSHVLRHFLPESMRRAYDMAGMIGLVLLFLVGGPIIRFLMAPVLQFFDFVLARI